MKTIIMAGGKGTRILSIASDIPKPMIITGKMPILEHQINCLKKNNLTDITIVIGYLGGIIKKYFDDGSRFDCKISYFNETNPLGTAGALYKISNLLDDFILLNGDLIFDIDFYRMITFHKNNNALATIAVHPNSHPFDSSLIMTNDNNQVINWINKEDNRTIYKNQVNAGIHIISPDLLKLIPYNNEKLDLDRDILKPSIKTSRIFAYHTPEYIKDMGTASRFQQVTMDIENGIVQRKNLSIKQKCIFLDRDGTINKINGYVTKLNNFELIDNAAEAIKKINMLGFLAIVITNQPGIAKGEIDHEELNEIHKKMETTLGENGAFIDDIFYCPHHPDKGFPGERAEYKIECECRKPKPGMILKAAALYNIDLSQSYMVGDDIRDAKAGIAAGCIPILLRENQENTEAIEDGNCILLFKSLLDFVDTCLFKKIPDNTDKLS